VAATVSVPLGFEGSGPIRSVRGRISKRHGRALVAEESRAPLRAARRLDPAESRRSPRRHLAAALGGEAASNG
jgi:hypothetical protein